MLVDGVCNFTHFVPILNQKWSDRNAVRTQVQKCQYGNINRRSILAENLDLWNVDSNSWQWDPNFDDTYVVGDMCLKNNLLWRRFPFARHLYLRYIINMKTDLRHYGQCVLNKPFCLVVYCVKSPPALHFLPLELKSSNDWAPFISRVMCFHDI